jgi:hypothetical protein
MAERSAQGEQDLKTMMFNVVDALRNAGPGVSAHDVEAFE